MDLLEMIMQIEYGVALQCDKILSSSGSSLTSWLTPGQVYEKSREDPEIGFVMG